MNKPTNKVSSNANIFMFDGGKRYSNRWYKKQSHKADRHQGRMESKDWMSMGPSSLAQFI